MTISLTLILLFLMGIANFAAHRGMLESGHPLVEEATRSLRSTFGRNATYVLEYILLVTAMMFHASHPILPVLLYGLYTMFNVLAYFWLHQLDQ